MRGAEHDQLWNQIEAEIHLHRHKTVIRACRGRRNPNSKTPAPPPPSQPESTSNDEEDAESKARKRRGIGEPRTVVIHKDKSEGLGISITVRVYCLDHQLFYYLLMVTGLCIRAGSRRSSPASLPGFAGYFHCFMSLNMSRRWTHNRLLLTKLRLLKNLKKTLW